MPKLKMSDQERMNRELLAALRAGQARLGEKDIDTAKYMPKSQAVYYRKVRAPQTFTVLDIRIIVYRLGGGRRG